jgi:hypothetical protein
MAGMGDLAATGAKALGGRFSIVGVVPSALVVLFLLAMSSSDLYPWVNERGEVGVAAILQRTERLSGADGVLLVFGILLVAVLFHPFQVALVRLLEGYWYGRWSDGPKALMIERHSRRYSLALLRATLTPFPPEEKTFNAVASYAVELERFKRLNRRADRILNDYPPEGRLGWMMPTGLGNTLRRAERMAGERYGLDTVRTYPRIYPHLSKQLDKQIGQQLDLVDTGVSIAVAFWICALAAAPLVGRADAWSVLPLALGILAVVAVRGSRTAARHYGTLLSTAFDLHRFQMVEALRLPLPKSAKDEALQNKTLREFFKNFTDEGEIVKPNPQWEYDQPRPLGATLTATLEAALVASAQRLPEKPAPNLGTTENGGEG